MKGETEYKSGSSRKTVSTNYFKIKCSWKKLTVNAGYVTKNKKVLIT